MLVVKRISVVDEHILERPQVLPDKRMLAYNLHMLRLGSCSILLLLSTAALAAEPTRASPRRVDPHQSAYEGACGSGGWAIRGVTIPTAGDAKQFKAEGIYAAAGQNQLFRFGDQIRAQCTEDSLICEHMTLTATVVSAATCAEGCGYSTFDGVSGNGRYGVLNCHFVAADATESFFKISTAGWVPWAGNDSTALSRMNVTARRGRCTVVGGQGAVGGGCNADADCGSGGTCTLTGSNREPLGVYLSAIPFANSGVCRISVCSQ